MQRDQGEGNGEDRDWETKRKGGRGEDGKGEEVVEGLEKHAKGRRKEEGGEKSLI